VEVDYMYSGREIYKELGYIKWSNFYNLIKKAQQIINNCLDRGIIVPTFKNINIGSGATRKVIDFDLDDNAIKVLKDISCNKLKKSPKARSETMFLSLVEKYCKIKNIKFDFQFRLDGYVFDCCVNNNILIEFDEPHHCEKRQTIKDRAKDTSSEKNNYKIIRVEICDDIIDIICKIEDALA